MYGSIGNGSPLSPGGILVLDQANGSGALLGDPVTPGGLSGLDFDANALFGTTIAGFQTTSALVEINPSTGSLVGSVGAILDSVNGLPLSIGDLAFDPVGEVMYGTRSATDGQGLAGELYEINTTTGIATLVGDTNVLTAGGLGFAPDGTLYMAAIDNSLNPVLATIDPSDASILTSVGLSVFWMQSGPSTRGQVPPPSSGTRARAG
jgi:hypothetical protein